MKKFDIYTLRLLRINGLYIAALVFFIFIILIYTPLRIKSYFDYKEQISSINRELQRLNKEKGTLAVGGTTNLDDMINNLNFLIPNKEDPLSIIEAIDRISQETGVRFLSYSSPFTAKKGGTGDRISIKAEVVGTPTAFMELLEKYPLHSGRLITMDAIDFSASGYQGTVVLTFYSKDVMVSQSMLDTEVINDFPQAVQRYNSIQNELPKNLPLIPRSFTESEEVDDYKTRRNPFGG